MNWKENELLEKILTEDSDQLRVEIIILDYQHPVVSTIIYGGKDNLLL